MAKYMENLKKDDLIKIYAVLWKYSPDFNEESLRNHIKGYIIQFYIMRHLKSRCREKAKLLLAMVRDTGYKTTA